jgi:hypothetical protein
MSEIKFTFGHSHYGFPAHDLPFQMGVGIVYTHIVPVLGDRLVGGQLFQLFFIILMESGFIIVDKDRGGDVHCVYEN